MKCQYCGIELSEKVCRIHENICPKKGNSGITEESTNAEIKAALDGLGIEYAKNATKLQLLELYNGAVEGK